MATDKTKGKGKGKKKGRGGEGEQHGPGKHHGGDPVKIHEEFIKRHVEGGAPATPEAYEQAIEQFSRLPGAVRTPVTDVNLIPSEQQPDEDEPDAEGQPDDESDKEES